MSGDFESRKYSHSTKPKWIPWILKLSFRESVIQIYLVYFLLIIWPFYWVKKRSELETWLNLWDNNPWSIFCDPHCELICCNEWHSGTLEISIPQEIAVRTHFHVRHDTKTTPVFLPADKEASWLSSLLSLLSSRIVQPENTNSCILRITGQVWESQKSFRSSVNQPNMKRWGARQVDVIKYLLLKVFLLQHHH